MINVIVRTALAMSLVCLVCGADWTRFRGPNGSGVAAARSLPTQWDQSRNVAWKSELPGRGLSCPIVIGDRIVVTCSSGIRQDRLHVVCIDADSGRVEWQRQFWATGRTMTHPKTCVAAPTPTSDGTRIFAYFSSNDVVALDMKGNVLWLRSLHLDFPDASNSLGLASSPIVIGDTLLVKIEADSQAVLLGLDTDAGQTRWQTARPKLASWTSPVLVVGGIGQPVTVALQSGKGMTAYDPHSGKEIWHYDQGCDTIASSVAMGDTIYVPSNGLVAIRQIESNSTPEVLWQSSRLRPSTAAPLIYDGNLYIINRSILSCANASNGRVKWQLRLPGNYSSSPIVANNHLFIFNEEGLGSVVRLDNEKGHLVGSGDLGETILATPAIGHNALYVRSDTHLWKIANAGK